MAQRVPDLTAKTSGFSLDDVVHIVDVSDTTDFPSGSSFKTTIGDLFIDLGVGIRMASAAGYTVYKASGNTDGANLEVGDRIEGVGGYFDTDYVIATVATTPVSDDDDFNTPIYRNASS